MPDTLKFNFIVDGQKGIGEPCKCDFWILDENLHPNGNFQQCSWIPVEETCFTTNMLNQQFCGQQTGLITPPFGAISDVSHVIPV